MSSCEIDSDRPLTFRAFSAITSAATNNFLIGAQLVIANHGWLLAGGDGEVEPSAGTLFEAAVGVRLSAFGLKQEQRQHQPQGASANCAFR
jgi:hypothetical protein